MANEMRMIDANWLKGIIRQYMKDHPGCQIFDTVMGLVCDMLNDSPTVDAVPVVHGRWEVLDGYVRCSVCGQIMDEDYNYCPNCGARMDGWMESQ